MGEFVFISEKNRKRYLRIIKPLGDLIARIGIGPNALSVIGLGLSVVGGIAYSTGSFFLAAWVVILAGTCDALDGQIARMSNQNSLFGAFFDSTMDRYSEMFLFMGLAYHFAGGRPIVEFSGREIRGEASPWVVVIILSAAMGSFMVSYTRARAGSLGVECKKGMMQRPERMVLLIVGSLLGSIPKAGPILLTFVLFVLAISSNVTAVYRIFFVRNRLFKENQVK